MCFVASDNPLTLVVKIHDKINPYPPPPQISQTPYQKGYHLLAHNFWIIELSGFQALLQPGMDVKVLQVKETTPLRADSPVTFITVYNPY